MLDSEGNLKPAMDNMEEKFTDLQISATDASIYSSTRLLIEAIGIQY